MKIPKLLFLTLIVSLGFSMASPCMAGKILIEPFAEEDRPTLFYRPGSDSAPISKYPVTLGVLTVRDKRSMGFYRESDGFFQEDIPSALTDIIYNEMRGSKIFGMVKRINLEPGNKLTMTELQALAKENQVDMLLLTDLSSFHMFRSKANKYGWDAFDGQTLVHAFKVSVNAQFVGQLIHPETATVVWADNFGRENAQLAMEGSLPAEELGSLTRHVVKLAINDMKTLIYKTGKRMVTP